MNVREIVKEWLEKNGYSGLYDESECGCAIDDLMPCDGPYSECMPGYKGNCDPETSESGFGFMIYAEKPEEK
jgi:hypothetical protein